jgi:hypothetical protein
VVFPAQKLFFAVWHVRYLIQHDNVHLTGSVFLAKILFEALWKKSNLVENHPRNIPAKFGSNRPRGFGEEA